MKKVICIDNKPHSHTPYPECVRKLVEGGLYTVIDTPHPIGYELKEIKTPNPYGFLASRFIPLSSIDETEMERNYSTVKTEIENL